MSISIGPFQGPVTRAINALINGFTSVKAFVFTSNTPTSTTSKLYSTDGTTLYWNGTILSNSGGNAPDDATYITQTPNATLSNEQAMSLLGTGIVKNTTTTGVQSIITPGTGVETALAANVGSAGAFVVNGGALGTPSSGTLTSATGLPVSSGISGLGTGVATALAVNVGTAGAPVVLNGALGTPSSGVGTNLTGTATALNIGGNAATATTATTATSATTAGTCSGNAATATILANARTIAGVSFNGSANIAIATTGLSDVTTTTPWTPVINYGGAVPTGITYGTQEGTYSVEGKVVSFTCYIALTNKGGVATGTVTLTGLPIVCAGPTVQVIPTTLSAVGVGIIAPCATMLNTSATVTLRNLSAGTLGNVADTDLTNGSAIVITGWYYKA